MAKNKEILTFKEKPLVRNKDTFYYGTPNDRFIIKIDILESKKFENDSIPTKLSVELIDVSDTKNTQLIMKGERNNLYDALEIGNIWIERALSETAE